MRFIHCIDASTMSNAHPAFTFIRDHKIDALNITIEHYEHKQTGATHYHLASDNPENVFLVGLRTVPMDHKGVAHILEHTALCGSKQYPVRDPFFMMVRRSLNTFMNAFTSNDWTAYPFASINEKDFFNLLDVYLDAVFFANLDELDFLQEGHRLSFEKAENTDSDLVYKGVVYNEMKGAMSSVSSILWQTLCKYLFDNTTYHYNSGGDPAHIPDLSYQELKDFYQKHYHPSNAMFMTYGNLEAASLQAVFEEKALKHFDKQHERIEVADEKRLLAPIAVSGFYPADTDEANKSHVVIGWLLGQSTNLQDVINAQLLSYILLENSASPLMHFLETTDLGAAPSPLCGLEDSYKELVFVCGLSDCNAENDAEIETKVLEVIANLAESGLPLKRLQAIVQQLELSQREVSGDSFPYGLQLILQGLTSVTHYSDPIELLDLEPVLSQLHEDIQKPDYVKNLLTSLLIDNPHRTRLTLKPDSNWQEKQQAAEAQKLAAIKAALSDTQKQAIVEKNQALEKRQAQLDDTSILPKVGIADIGEQAKDPAFNISTTNNIQQYHFNQGTNGLVYQQIVIDMPKLDEQELQYLPLYCQLLTEVGIGDQSFTDVQNWQSETVGSINAFYTMRNDINDDQTLMPYFILSAKALQQQQENMVNLLEQTLKHAQFTETDRIKDIVTQIAKRKEQSITGQGHSLAMQAAVSNFNPLANLSESWTGISSVAFYKQLQQDIQNSESLAKLAKQLESIHQKIQNMHKRIVSISEAQYQQQSIAVNAPYFTNDASTTEAFEIASTSNKPQHIAWLCNSQVNFCAKAYPTVMVDHPDAAALTVLGGFLRNGYLHSAVREKGGAYGGGATQDSATAAFKFYSYRDPRIQGTLDDFDASLAWLEENNHTPEQLEEAILGVIASLDKPSSPAGTAKQCYFNLLFGRDQAQRQRFRERVLSLSIDDLKRVAKSYLTEDKASVAVISHSGEEQALNALNLEINKL